MTVRVEKNGAVTTVIHSRAHARNAMDPASADALVAAEGLAGAARYTGGEGRHGRFDEG